jgi:hypothetical protein
MAIGLVVLSKVLNKVEFLILSDRDERSDEEKKEWLEQDKKEGC